MARAPTSLILNDKNYLNKLLSLHVYYFSPVTNLSSENCISSTGHKHSWYQQRRHSKDADRETQTCNPSVINRLLLVAIEPNNSKASGGNEFSLS